MDIEWGKDGESGEIMILQARPETVQSRAGRSIQRYTLRQRSKVLATGRSIGQRIGAGPVRVIHSVAEMARVQALADRHAQLHLAQPLVRLLQLGGLLPGRGRQ